MKLVFMGAPDFSAGILEALIRAGYEIGGVVTQPDRPKGRKKEPAMCPAKECAVKHAIPVYQPEKLSDGIAADPVLAWDPDLIVVAAYGQIIPDTILNAPKYGCLNVHTSLLPAYRGASPIQQVILDGCETTGVTVMRMDSGLDTGDIIAQCEVAIAPDETGGSLFDRLMEAGADLLIRTIPTVADGTAVYTKQPQESPTPVTKRIEKSAGRIDWSLSADEIERCVRAYCPWPSAFTSLDGRNLRIFRAHVEAPDLTGEAGVIVRQDKRGIYVQTGRGILCLDELQIEGKKRMTTGEFLRGYTIRRNRLGE